jgi:hypothetical protein
MTCGYRKLCDIHAHLKGAVEMRAAVEKYLIDGGIPFEVQSQADAQDRDLWRYCVPSAQLNAARAGIPLTLRGLPRSQ